MNATQTNVIVLGHRFAVYYTEPIEYKTIVGIFVGDHPDSIKMILDGEVIEEIMAAVSAVECEKSPDDLATDSWAAYELARFDATEARAINGGAL